VKAPFVIETPRHLYVIAHDPNAGVRHRYTTHQIDRFGMCAARVISRELPLREARYCVAAAEDILASARKDGAT
jgi:hypothetical protein